jgi:hypothetical protein
MGRTTLASTLLLLFLSSLIINFGLLLHFYPMMRPPDRNDLSSELLKIHSVPIAILLGGMFAHITRRGRVRPLLAGAAIGLSILWAGFVTTSWIGFPEPISATGADSVYAYLVQRSGDVSFLIAGMLAYVCGPGIKLDK